MILFFLPFSHLHKDRITMLWKREKNHGIIEVLTPSKLHQILRNKRKYISAYKSVQNPKVLADLIQPWVGLHFAKNSRFQDRMLKTAIVNMKFCNARSNGRSIGWKSFPKYCALVYINAESSFYSTWKESSIWWH